MEEGLIQRSEDPDDRRMKQIILTAKGHQVIKETIDARLGWIEELTVNSSEEEKEQITSAFELIINRQKNLVSLEGKLLTKGVQTQCGDFLDSKTYIHF